MAKVFDIYLAKADQPDSAACAELSLPATPYEMQDAFDKLRLTDGEIPYWEITGYRQFEELSSVLNDTCGLQDLNALAQKLSELDERQCTAFAGLLAIEQRKNQPIPISRLIDIAYSTDCCHVVDTALNDFRLGRFLAENDFLPEAVDLSDEVFELLDFERIGREHRQAEGGIFVARTADHPGGYVEQHGALIVTAAEVMRVAKKKLPGHFCKVCGMRKSNESFSGRGHAAHIVGAKSALFRFRLRRKLHSAPLPLLSPRDPLRWARAGSP